METAYTGLKKRLFRIEKHIGTKLRERRLQLHLSQHGVAHQLSVSGQQIHKYEKGIDRIPASRLYELSKILGVPLGYFYDGLEGDGSSSQGQELVVTCANLKDKKVRIEFLNLDVILSDAEIL
ncbi:helix-turn-helix domain-containing protein [Candidatus Paracaedibacter symbiosus]|uniref:helix-turn-helix domain-containing protein n=1 Tax=Candidatus Paracaedibacter symbiosus TaxID=244582 RepID=UPI00068A0699|nr:helix-turn-helix transcriptional regulator [Candidatus Paracaedibacter symbiosus]